MLQRGPAEPIQAVLKYQAELLAWIKDLPFDPNVGLCQSINARSPTIGNVIVELIKILLPKLPERASVLFPRC